MTYLISSTGLSARIHTLPEREPFMLAADLAEAYVTRTDLIGTAVKRNPTRFPEDFAFRLSEAEMEALKTQNALSTKANRDMPLAFTHGGALALSGVLKTPIAAEVSVIVHRTFAAMEKQATLEMKYRLARANCAMLMGGRDVIRVVTGVRDGMTFAAIKRMGRTSAPKLADVVYDCFARGLIDRIPAGTPATSPDLFAEG